MKNNELALVIGGSGDLGTAIIERLLDRGIQNIISTYRTSIPDIVYPKYVTWVQYDTDTDPLGERVVKVLGERPVNYMVFAAGQPSSKKNISETSHNEWSNLLEVNAISFSNLYREIHKLVRIGDGRVLVISSDTTKKLGPGNGPYSASKAALEAIAITLSKEELPFGVRVNIFAPTLFDSKLAEKILKLKGVTDIESYKQSLPWGHSIPLNEVADSAVSLLCDDSWRYATSQIFRLGAE